MSTVVWMCLTSSKTNIKNIEQKSLNSFSGQKVLVVMHVYCIVQIQIFNIQNNHVNRSSKLSRANCKRDMIQNQKVKASWCTPVVVRGEDELEIDPIRIGSLENLFRLYRIHHCSFFGALINDSAAVQNQIEVYWPIIWGVGGWMKWNEIMIVEHFETQQAVFKLCISVCLCQIWLGSWRIARTYGYE